MVTAKEAFEAKKLAAKYGVVGKVAGRYRIAGYQIEILDPSEEAIANFIAYKRGEKLIVKVYNKAGYIDTSVIEKLSHEASSRNSKGILILYGAGPKVKGELIEKAKELGISIRRVRP